VPQSFPQIWRFGPLLTDCNAPQLVFEGFLGRQIVGDFDGGAVTSNAGALLLRETDRIVGLMAKVVDAIRDGRDQDAMLR
jgi:Transposase DDE domain group 1